MRTRIQSGLLGIVSVGITLLDYELLFQRLEVFHFVPRDVVLACGNFSIRIRLMAV
jgi:hypothetical protein